MSRATTRNIHVQDQVLAAVAAINPFCGLRPWVTTQQVREAVGITNPADMSVWRALDRLARRGLIARCDRADPAYLGVPALWRPLTPETDDLEAMWTAEPPPSLTPVGADEEGG